VVELEALLRVPFEELFCVPLEDPLEVLPGVLF
jgi:hypothetical protein